MALFNRPFNHSTRHPDPTDGSADFSGHDGDSPLALGDPRLPERVRSMGQSFGSDLAYVLRTNTPQGIEWWFMSKGEQLLEAMWFE